LGSRIIRYVRDGQTDEQTDGRTKSTLIGPFSTVGSIIISKCCELIKLRGINRSF